MVGNIVKQLYITPVRYVEFSSFIKRMLCWNNGCKHFSLDKK